MNFAGSDSHLYEDTCTIIQTYLVWIFITNWLIEIWSQPNANFFSWDFSQVKPVFFIHVPMSHGSQLCKLLLQLNKIKRCWNHLKCFNWKLLSVFWIKHQAILITILMLISNGTYYVNCFTFSYSNCNVMQFSIFPQAWMWEVR